LEDFHNRNCQSPGLASSHNRRCIDLSGKSWSVGQLFGSLKTLKHGDTEFNFSQEIGDARADVVDAGLASQDIPNDPKLLDLASSHPRLAVIEAWQRIEAVLHKLSAEDSDLGGKYVSHIYRKLRDREMISKSNYYLIRELRSLRNKAAHIGEEQVEISAADAYDFIEMSKIALKVLSAIDPNKEISMLTE